MCQCLVNITSECSESQSLNIYHTMVLTCYRLGHALMAFRLSRVVAPLPADKTMELGHHILKAHIYKSIGRQRGYSSRDMQAFWMCLSSHSLSQALVTHRNVFCPNVKVSTTERKDLFCSKLGSHLKKKKKQFLCLCFFCNHCFLKRTIIITEQTTEFICTRSPF